MPLIILTRVQSLQSTKGHSLCIKSYDIQTVKIISTPIFYTPQPLANPPNPTPYYAFQLARHAKSAPPPVGASIPHVIHVPWTLPTQHPKLHLDQSGHFCTAHDKVPILHSVH